MKLYILAIRDSKADEYMQLYCAQSLGAAERSFLDECNREDSNNMLYKHPEDFELFCLGEYESDTGSVKPYDNKLSIALGSNVKRKVN